MKILLANVPGFTPDMFAAIEALGLEPVFLPGENGRPGFEQRHYDMDFSDIDIVVCYRFFCYNDIAQFRSLKYIHTTSSGLDHMPMDYIAEHGIHLCNARGVYSVPMAEFALGSVLQLYRSAELMRTQQQAHRWKQHYNMRELGGKIVTLLGTGSVGTECAKRFSAMGCLCVGLCRNPQPDAPHYARQLSVDRLDEVLPETDILILALPLTDETHHIINAHRLSLLPRDAIVVNMARGAVVDTAALLDALETERIAGAAADVFEQEPLPPDSPVWDCKNLIVTPHNSYVGENNPRRLFDLVYRDTVNWLKEMEDRT
ncbi:MAG: D-2-hydroxyacid dehydrogenase [Ruminococcaceae bacterium]|nr:D-2-hydroxyacid dehydrogenase [Oscillospiraceae bacterium]